MYSAGDWAFQYSGGIVLTNAESITISNNIFSRMDGNGIFMFEYNRYNNINNNIFEWIGDSCIGSWGSTSGYTFHQYDHTNTRYAKLGIDGTNGNQPRMNNISYNFAREIGINEKQSSFYFQAVSCQNYVGHNIVFNGPRAGINVN